MKKVLLISIIALIVSCHHQSFNSDNLEFKTEIDKYSTDYYINTISDIKFNEGKYYLIEENIPRLFLLDSDLTYINSFGSLGKGPREFLSMGAIGITSKYLFISDIRRNRLMCYNKLTLEFIEEVNFPENIHITYGDFFIDEEGYVTTIRNNKIEEFGLFNIRTQKFSPFYGQEKYDISDYRMYKFYGDLNNDIIIALPRYSNHIFLFSRKNMNLFNEIEVEIPKKSYDKWNYLRSKGKNTPLFTDCQIIKDAIFILFQDLNSSSRSIIELNLNSDSVSPYLKIHTLLPKNGDECICVNKRNVFTFSRAKGTLQKYVMN